ncbi:MAG: hypothetical protein IKX51_02775, partial [Bacteroidales bacterium]|nr:hypothetical protein [Bacteroidales bacterium]
MNKIIRATAIALIFLLITACGKELPQNMEADMLTFSIREDGRVMEIPAGDNIVNYYLSTHLDDTL